jgi:hypothetical protein
MHIDMHFGCCEISDEHALSDMLAMEKSKFIRRWGLSKFFG